MPVTLRTSATGPGTPLHHHWSNCVGAGRAAEGLRAEWQHQLSLAADLCGFRYVRFHGLFHDDMFVYRQHDGRAAYHFQYVDTLLDKLLDLGVRPFVELGFCPADLATSHRTAFWWDAHGSPPNNLDRWADLTGAATRHWIERYGRAEVRSWYFEVWHEPNLEPYWHGTRGQYFELYEATVRAIKTVDGALRVGGPATGSFVPDARYAGEVEDTAAREATRDAPDPDSLDWRPVWLAEFLDFCAKRELPVDFISTHPYPIDASLPVTRDVDATPRDLAVLRSIRDAGPYRDAEIHVTAWNSSPSSRDFTHDYLQAATFIVRTNLHSLGLVDSLVYRGLSDFTEEQGAGTEMFHGGCGMLTVQGIAKPAWHAYRFLHFLGDELLARTDGAVVTRRSEDGLLRALIYHYPEETAESVPASYGDRRTADETIGLGAATWVELDVSGLRAGARVVLETVDRVHGNAMTVWDELRRPAYPTREQTAVIRDRAACGRLETATVGADGYLRLDRAIDAWTILSVREEPT